MTMEDLGKYKPYPAYKDSGIEWIGNVPEYWDISPLKWQIERNDGGVWGDDPDGENDTIVLRSTEQTVDGRWQIEDPAKRKINTTDKFSALLKNGDLLLTKSSGSSLHIGKTTLVTPEVSALNCCYSNFMQRIRTKHSFIPQLAWYMMNNDLARLQFGFLSNSTTGLANLNGSLIGQIVLPIAPLHEQQKIAIFLDRETAKIDKLIAKQERLIEILQEKRSTLISNAVTKGLKPDITMKESGISWIGEIPSHWEVLKIKWIAKMESGHTPNKKVDEYWADCDIPWVSLNDTGRLKENDFISDTTIQINHLGIANSSARLLPPEAVVFSRDATIGRCAITTRPMAVSQHFIAWLCGDRIIPEYLLRVIRSMTQELERLTFGSTIKTIGMPDVRTLVTPLPPLDEQKGIIDTIRRETAKIDTLIAKAKRSLELLQEHRSSLISAAVTGKIDVRNLVEPSHPKGEPYACNPPNP